MKSFVNDTQLFEMVVFFRKITWEESFNLKFIHGFLQVWTKNENRRIVYLNHGSDTSRFHIDTLTDFHLYQKNCYVVVKRAISNIIVCT